MWNKRGQRRHIVLHVQSVESEFVDPLHVIRIILSFMCLYPLTMLYIFLSTPFFSVPESYLYYCVACNFNDSIQERKRGKNVFENFCLTKKTNGKNGE